MTSRRANALATALDDLAGHSVLLFGGKGGVGKTTISAAAALHYSGTRPVVLFSTDPASSLPDLLAPEDVPFRIESLDAEREWTRFLDENLGTIVQLIERGTILEDEEIRLLLTRSVPGIDEIMGWRKIFELHDALPENGMLVVDTAPTGHTLRLLQARAHFDALTGALEAMSEKHREIVFQLAGGTIADEAEAWLDDFREAVEREAAVLADGSKTAFVVVAQPEDLIVEQSVRLASEVRELGVEVPLVVLNRISGSRDCGDCAAAETREALARAVLEKNHRVAGVERLCHPVTGVEELRELLGRRRPRKPPASENPHRTGHPLSLEGRRLIFVAGKGGTGKTSVSASVALQLSRRTSARVHVLSVDPAHSLIELMKGFDLPGNLTVERVDPGTEWKSLEDELERALDEIFGDPAEGKFRAVHDEKIARSLLDIAPPGADEIFALMKIVDLIRSDAAEIVIDTAPTGHFLRLLDLPELAGAWVRQLMKILLDYSEVLPAGSLAATLVDMSRALRELQQALGSNQSAVVVVTRPEPMVAAETSRLIGELERRKLDLAGVVANYLTPASECPCDAEQRAAELAILERFPESTMIDRREPSPASIESLEALVPMRGTGRRDIR